MIQLDDLEELKKEDIPKLLNMIDPILRKRKELYRRLTRDGSDGRVFYSSGNDKTKIPIEQFVTTVGSGYLAGKAPIYSVSDNDTEERSKLVEELLDKPAKEEDYKDRMEILIDYITKYNDDGAEHFDLTEDALGLTSCYEVLWEDEDNEIRYKNYSPLQTVAIYDYTIDKNLIGLVRKYYVTDINSKLTLMVELVDKNGTRTFSVSDDYKEVTELEPENHNWGDVPATVYESDFSIFETIVDLIKAFEQLIQNNRNLFEYNDSGCKLKVKGYQPKNPMFEEKEVDGQIVQVYNQARLDEDRFVLDSKVIYLGEDGDIDWIVKNINDTATQNTIKTYMDLMTMMSCVPNITDTGFTNADNNSAIQNKYFALSQKLIKLRKGFEKMYLRRWELIFNRINLKKNTQFDFRDIKIELPVNIPTNEQEEIDNTLKLKDIISEETLLTKLGFNYNSEKNKMETEAQENFENNMNNVMGINGMTDEQDPNNPLLNQEENQEENSEQDLEQNQEEVNNDTNNTQNMANKPNNNADVGNNERQKENKK